MVSVSAPARRTAFASLAVVVALALGGCVDTLQPEPDPTTTTTPRPTETATPTPLPTPGGGPVGVSCDELNDPDAVYAFDPNFAFVGAYAPDAGTPAATAVAADGVACRWVRESGGDTIDLWVAKLPDEQLTQLKNEAFASSQMVPTYGDEAYFDPATGTATVFEGPYWLVITSPAFAEPGEPTEMIEAALSALP